MGALLTRLTAFLVSAFTALFGSWKSVLLVTLLAFGAIALYNLCVDIIEEILNFVVAYMQGIHNPEGAPSGGSIAGVGGWLLIKLRVPECLAFIISCISLKFIARKIPFIKW